MGAGSGRPAGAAGAGAAAGSIAILRRPRYGRGWSQAKGDHWIWVDEQRKQQTRDASL